MLTGVKFAFLGGDARMIEVARCVSELDASTVMVGFEKADVSFPDSVKVAFSEEVLKDADVIVFPVAGIDDEGRVPAQFAEQPIMMTEDHFAVINKKTQLFTGIARPRFGALAKRHGLALVRLMELDEVAILNSIPTAEGAIALAMEHTEITLHGSACTACTVLGLGRCGVTLARVLAGMGAAVTVCARKPSDLARIREMGLTAIPLEHLGDAIASSDVVFNTIPAMILTSDILARAARFCVIIDLASAPGGTDFRFAEKRGIKAMLAPSLPGIVAPKTAGRIIAQTMVRMVQEASSSTGG
ncbi:dipicolinate synthase subunit A [Ferroacidibacillus organovorans]|nr:dipicolinate synthase subunit DpsA [Ferroacidibacillus organovorans]KYP82194.1 dipicolinate synthase subunit A [Ferroacidibacillus organovorans]